MHIFIISCIIDYGLTRFIISIKKKHGSSIEPEEGIGISFKCPILDPPLVMHGVHIQILLQQLYTMSECLKQFYIKLSCNGL